MDEDGIQNTDFGSQNSEVAERAGGLSSVKKKLNHRLHRFHRFEEGREMLTD
jgi:hypothetical protein